MFYSKKSPSRWLFRAGALLITSKFEAATLERVKELCEDIGRYWFCGAVKDLHSVRGISSTAAGEGEVFAWLLKAGESLTLLRDSFQIGRAHV